MKYVQVINIYVGDRKQALNCCALHMQATTKLSN